MEKLSQFPRLFLTSMSGPGQIENMTEMIEPILDHVDGIIWVLNDCPKDDPGARYLETVKGAGCIIYRSFIPRYAHLMNETLFTGLVEEGEMMIWTDPLERPAAEFLKKAKSEIAPFMDETGTSCIYFYGKPYLFRYYETLQYQQSPHWGLTGYPGRAIEWSQIEPNERKVRLNVRPEKRKDRFHWVGHMLRYWVAFPEGSNCAALGLDHFPPGDKNAQFAIRERQRLEFRKEMKRRGYSLTVDGFVSLCKEQLDDRIKEHLRHEKTLSDAYHYLVLGDTSVTSDHNPSRAIPVK
jgi:hypothetical protein